jgi:hypothetical protein
MCDNFTLVTLLGMRFFLFSQVIVLGGGEHLNRWHLRRAGEKKSHACNNNKKEEKQKRLYPKRNLTASARAFQITPCNCSVIDFSLFASHKKSEMSLALC